jgi:hypothetical protein
MKKFYFFFLLLPLWGLRGFAYAQDTVTSFPTTLCTQCCWDGGSKAWVDCYVTMNAYPFDNNTTNTAVVWSGNGSAFCSGASGPGSDKNGRANTASIRSTGISAVQLCKDLGVGWYLPAYEELYAMSSGAARTSSNNRVGANVLALPRGYFWSSTEYYDNKGSYLDISHGDGVYARIVDHTGLLGFWSKTGRRYVRCAWRQ